ncbi:hypothetical protein, partial [Staphylococcus aureus]|uniref:hypothetical protein n=1 Tax=Staphylococcus aureus TaxID=1280 RepID=UPI001BFE97E8
ILGIRPAVQAGASGGDAAGQPDAKGATAPEPRFKTDEERGVAKLALEAIQKATRDPKAVPGPAALTSPEVQERLVVDVKDR